MKHFLSSLLKSALCAFVAVGSIASAAAEDKAVSATGSYAWSMPGRDGGEARKYSMTLTHDGEKLTGKVKSPGRDGAETETEIAEGSVKAGEVSFTVTREWNGNKRVATYTGKLTADAITGKIASKDREGNDQTRDWTAKRDTAK